MRWLSKITTLTKQNKKKDIGSPTSVCAAMDGAWMDFPVVCCMEQSSSCPWREALPLVHLSYYRISLQENC